ncbi:hypothetical protein FSOLCH5_009996 [Fusarium solani]|jgi:hypothetical protein|uniref:uncharacterized protein n=1 Tax=Fusarium solani TaxID=169388 RepID=UPI002317D098|nr:hypothetical protein MRS44_012191 [Fusarium solani]KAJ4233136.1 hypothetical protein NW759_001918 [Fusarium solani]
MPVNEFALLRLKSGYDEDKFLKLVKAGQADQAQWIREHQPHLLEGKAYTNPSNFYLQKSDPPYLVITAPWDSPEGHGEWIQSDVNKSAMGGLLEFIAEGPDGVVLFHMKAAGSEDEVRGDLLVQGSFNIWRISVDSDQKEKLQELYRSVELQIGNTNPNQRVWGGWKVEEGEKEELVVFSQKVKEDVLSPLAQVPNVQVRRYEVQGLL